MSGRLLRWGSLLLAGTTWVSAAIFGVYILAFFGGSLLRAEAARWNESLPQLYNPDAQLSTAAIGAHFVAGGIILMLGPIQLIAGVRERMPRFHWWTGRLYILTTLAAGVGGCLFIAIRGTIGGWPMSIGFALYGALMVCASLQTIRHARARRIAEHRLWGMRLYALAIGSWLYRIEYGFWLLAFNGTGHTATFDGPFDVVMAFFFYLPNLAIVECYGRASKTDTRPLLRWIACAVMLAATAFVSLATVEMTRLSWGPAILDSLR